MLRVLIVEILLFLVPFALYGAYLLLRRRPMPAKGSEERFWLVVAGLVSAIAGFVGLATF